MSATFREVEAGGLLWRVFGTSGGNGGGNDSAGSVRTGNDTPLIILHGLFGAGDNWRSHAEYFSRERLILVPDMPNHGRSRHTADMSFGSVARYVWNSLAELTPAIEIDPDGYALLGHSMGGKVAMAMAFHEPQRTAHLISADIAPREYPSSHQEIFNAMAAVAQAQIHRRSEADRIMAESIPTKAVRMFLLKSLVRDEASGTFQWQLNVDGLRRSYDDIRAWPFHDERYEGPTLFIAGGDSPYIRPADTNAIDRHFPDHRLETIPGVGHWLHVENREAFLELVTTFLS
ncbi:MAG TPA: alpha/beta fold hydrolase [Alkalispirochaeta sp.]|nr:alpha/beta fold hydrolase [Alkalispirochaeta sp.]